MLLYLHYQHGIALYDNTHIIIPTSCNETHLQTKHPHRIFNLIRNIRNYCIYSHDYTNCLPYWEHEFRIFISNILPSHDRIRPIIYSIHAFYLNNPTTYYYLIDLTYYDINNVYEYNIIPFIAYGLLVPTDGILAAIHYYDIYNDYL